MKRNFVSSACCVWSVTTILVLGGLASAALADTTGKLVWVELITENSSKAASFYMDLLGWDIDMGENNLYVAYLDGKPIASISQIDDEVEEEEAQWLVGLEVEDLSASVSAARRLGATVHVDDGGKKGFAQYAIIEDLEGAPVVLVAPEKPLGGERVAGAWVWAELWTDNLEGAAEFYREVIGYDRSERDVSGSPYPVFEIDGEPRAGIFEIEGRAVDPIWAPYLAVRDVTTTVQKAKSLGGRVLLEPRPDLRDGRVALLADPTGGAFFIYQIEVDS